MPGDDPWRVHLEALGELIRSQRKLAKLSLRDLAARTSASSSAGCTSLRSGC